ncbi:hypothetical protein ACFW3D_32860 [Streptomyces sp. NPDC058864]
MKRARLAALTTGLAAALTLTACGVPPTGVIEAGEPAGGMSSPTPRTAKPTLVSLYFLQDGKLRAYARKSADPGNVGDAVTMLFGGPTADESATVTTELPFLKNGPQVKEDADGTVYIQLPKGLTQLSHPAMLQLACTVSSVSTSLAALHSAAAVGGAGAKPDATPGSPPHDTVHVLGDGWTMTQTAGSCPAAVS